MPSNLTSTSSCGSQGPASVRDAEKSDDQVAQTARERPDIEHVHVDDDPRKWSNMRKASIAPIVIGIFSNLVSRQAY